MIIGKVHYLCLTLRFLFKYLVLDFTTTILLLKLLFFYRACSWNWKVGKDYRGMDKKFLFYCFNCKICFTFLSMVISWQLTLPVEDIHLNVDTLSLFFLFVWLGGCWLSDLSLNLDAGFDVKICMDEFGYWLATWHNGCKIFDSLMLWL